MAQELRTTERARRKARWALQELKSLEALYAAGFEDVGIVRGSYAGAFGVPQFVPSSYERWARSAQSDSQPDLFRIEDAIHSVAYYLHAQGWTPGNENSQRAALFHYNHSREYGEIILKLARLVRTAGKPPPRPRG